MTPAYRLRFAPPLAIRALGLLLAAASAAPAAPAEAAEELEASDAPAAASSAPAAASPAPAAPSPAPAVDSARNAAAPPATPAPMPAIPADTAAALQDTAAGTAKSAPAGGSPTAAGSAPAAADTGTAAPPIPAAAASAAPPAVAAEASDELTIEVDESRSRNEGKSLPLAMLYSAVLPGAGELYLQEPARAKTFLLVEAGFWAALYVSIVAKESYLQSARNHASQYAGIDASSKDEDFLETMGTYRSYQEKQHRQDSYELAQVLQNKRERDYDIPPSPENYWDFGSSSNPQNTSNWKEFQSTLRYYRASKVAMSFALGALAMNRLASMVNTLQTYKRTSASSASWDVTPDLGPEYAGARLSIRF